MPSSLDRGGWAVPNQKVRFKRTRFSRSLTRGNSESQVRTKWVPGDSHQMLKSFATVTVQGSLANMSGLTCRLPPVHMLSLFFSLSHTHTEVRVYTWKQSLQTPWSSDRRTITYLKTQLLLGSNRVSHLFIPPSTQVFHTLFFLPTLLLRKITTGHDPAQGSIRILMNTHLDNHPVSHKRLWIFLLEVIG